MAGTRKRPSRRAPAPRSRSRSRRPRPRRVLPRWPPQLPRLPQLDQRRRDVLALGLIALGVFMGVVLYGDGDGGRVGHAFAVALGWSVGRARVLAPLALVGSGAALLMRPVLPELRPLRAGSTCLFCAVVLALAAGTLGVSEGRGGSRHWSSHYLQVHGGAVGQTLYE